MGPTFEDKADDVIDYLENPGNMTAFIFSAHDSEGGLSTTTARRPGIGDIDWALLLGADINRVSKVTGLHKEDIVEIALEKARQIDDSDSVIR